MTNIEHVCRFTARCIVGDAVVVKLVRAIKTICANADFKQITSLQIVGDLALALETEACARGIVRSNINVAAVTIVPEQQGLIDKARHFELDLAIALARRCRFELGDPLLKVGAAIAAKVGCRRRHHAPA